MGVLPKSQGRIIPHMGLYVYLLKEIYIVNVAILGVKEKTHTWKCINSIGLRVFEFTNAKKGGHTQKEVQALIEILKRDYESMSPFF